VTRDKEFDRPVAAKSPIGTASHIDLAATRTWPRRTPPCEAIERLLFNFSSSEGRGELFGQF
jgi:hypothetical protein